VPFFLGVRGGIHFVRRVVKAALGERVLYFVKAYTPHVSHSRCLTRPSQPYCFNRLVSSLNERERERGGVCCGSLLNDLVRACVLRRLPLLTTDEAGQRENL